MSSTTLTGQRSITSFGCLLNFSLLYLFGRDLAIGEVPLLFVHTTVQTGA